MCSDCDVNCHKKCEKLMPNLCGVNQKLIVEALASLKKGKIDLNWADFSHPIASFFSFFFATRTPHAFCNFCGVLVMNEY